jgi:predicted Rossmann fold nucleotide-binding protein DprA/Smf involved in DNA uptake
MSTSKLHALQELLEQASSADAELLAMRKTNAILRQTLERIGRLVAKTVAKVATATPAKKGRRPRLAEGSLEHRLTSAAAEPVTLKALAAAGNARPQDVKKAVLKLEKEGRLLRLGAGRNTKYRAAA